MVQTAGVQGDHNTVVQIEGDGNTVVLGRPYLKLTRFDAERNKPLNDARLLIPARRAIPLVGRDEELKALLDFVQADAPNDIRVRVLVGGGGSGKTRLALELCDRIKDTWLAGFATTVALERFFKQQDAGAWGWQKPTLIVLDYAAAQADVLQKWLPELQDRASAPLHPLRILLLERHADAQSGWHQRVFNPGGWQNAGLRDMLDPPEPVRIRPLVEVADRMGVVCAVLRLIRPELMHQVTRDLLDRQFQDTVWGGDPLYLAMAALTMAQRGDVSALRLGRTDLALEVAGHEMNRLAQAARSRGLEPELVQHLAACITLLQGQHRTEALALIRTEKQAIGFEQGDSVVLADVLYECLVDGERIAPVLPDLIGEALLIKAWGMLDRAAAITRLFPIHPARVLETLVRVAQDFSDVDSKPKGWFEALLKDNWTDLHALQCIYASMPALTVSLGDVNLRIAQRLQCLDTSPEPEVRASYWTNLAVALSDVGQHEEALEAAQQAADLYRELARRRPDVFSPDWVKSLGNLANCLSAVGQHEAALAAAQQAVDLYRDLAHQQPYAYAPAWAMLLNNLANRLSIVGKHEAALAAAQQAVDLRRDLARQRPEVYSPAWALSLNNLANMLSRVGKQDEALSVAEQAVGLYQVLARQRPDAYTSYLAGSLSNLASSLSNVGQHDASLTAAQQAADLYGDLARRLPDVYARAWAASLNTLANSLGAMGQHDKALGAAQRVTSLYRDLARERPDAYSSNWAMSLNNLAHVLSEVGQSEAALMAAQQCTDLYRGLARQRPDAYEPDWAMSLNTLANMFGDVGQFDAALGAARQAADLYEHLARQCPDAYTSDWAMSLNNLSRVLSAVGQLDAALDAAQQATDLYRFLTGECPAAHTQDWATSLIVLALSQSQLGRPEDAARNARLAVEVLRPAFSQRPQALAGRMSAMLRDYVHLCEAAQVELDMVLLAPLIPYFQSPTKENLDD